MKYRKIKAAFTDAPERLYRVFYAREDLNIFELSCVILTYFQAAFEHLFEVRSGQRVYSIDGADPDFGRVGVEFVDMKKHLLGELQNKFTFEYDFGEGWEFKCTLYKKAEELNDDRPAILLEGKGAGIWEDNIGSLWLYLNGKLDPDSDEENAEECITLPWNLALSTYGEFDDELDIDEEQEDFDISYEVNLTGFESDDALECLEEEFGDEMPQALAMPIAIAMRLIETNETAFNVLERLLKKHCFESALFLIASTVAEEAATMEKEKAESLNEPRLQKRLEDLR